MKVGVLISGRGSNLQSLIDATARPDFPAEIVLVVSNRPGAKGLERAEKAGIAVEVVDHKGFPDRSTFEAALTHILLTHRVELVCLAGFMRVLDAGFVYRWQDRMINIHPSLLPAFKGLNTHERALEAGVRLSGCTVHFVRAEMDDGPIILQAVVPVLPGDKPDDLAERVLGYEHRIYPEALRLVASGAARVSGDVVVIRDGHWSESGLINPQAPETGR